MHGSQYQHDVEMIKRVTLDKYVEPRWRRCYATTRKSKVKAPRMKDLSVFPFAKAQSEIDKTKSAWTAMVKANGPIKTRQQVRLNLTMSSWCCGTPRLLARQTSEETTTRRLAGNAKYDVLCL